MSTEFTIEQCAEYACAPNKLDHVNLYNCSDEPIQVINAVQSCGYVVVVCSDTSKIAQVSSNMTDFGYDPNDLLGRDLGFLFDDHGAIESRGQILQAVTFQHHSVSVNSALVKIETVTDVTLNASDGKRDVTAFVTTSNIPRHFVVEIEVKRGPTFNSASQQMHLPEDSVDAVLAETCTKMRTLTGFHQGMVYRFDSDGTGEIVFEDKVRPETRSFEGMRFPSTDIPVQARLLYLRNGVRFIYDTHEQTYPLLPSRIDKQQFLDMSEIKVRAVSPIHIAYLRNIGVRSSMSVAISVQESLWGLFSFHHHGDPLFVDWNTRRICGILGAVVGMRVESLLREKDARNALRVTDAFTHVFQGVEKVIGFFDSHWSTLADVFSVCSGIISTVDGRETGSFGSRMDSNVVNLLVSWAIKVQNVEVTTDIVRWASERASGPYELLFQDGSPIGGAVFIRLYSYVIVFLRVSSAADARWTVSDVASPGTLKALGPPQSFNKYLAEVGTSSKRWTTSETRLFGMLFDKLLAADHREQTKVATEKLNQAHVDMKTVLEERQRYSQFVANISHELRTPFSAAMASLEIVLSTKDIQLTETLEYVRSAHRSGSHMLRILNDFLFVNKMSVDAGTFQLVDTVYNTCDLCGVRSWPSVSIETGENVVVTGDPDRVTQIFDNLITNAVKFSDEQLVKVTLFVRRTFREVCEDNVNFEQRFQREDRVIYNVDNLEVRTDDPTQIFLVCAVEDDGIGIQKADVSRIFTPFGHVNRKTTRRYGGTGLGLSICRELVRLMKGRLICHSCVGTGTTMVCVIPTTFGRLEQERGVANRLPSTSITGTILLVDDQAVNLKLLKRQVEIVHPHATILLAKDGVEATELFEEHVGAITLCLVDFHMPKKDGKEAIRCMREIEEKRGIPRCSIYLLTADAVERAERTSVVSGATEVLLKPLKLDVLRTL